MRLEAEGAEIPLKLKSKSRRSDESSDHGLTGDERKVDPASYKPADSKLKSISEITKKRLKQSDPGYEFKKSEVEDETSDVLKSKVTSLKTVIGAADKQK